MTILHRIFTRRAFFYSMILISCLFGAGISCSNKNNPPTTSNTTPASLNSINHIVVIYLENHSFDNLYGEFPGANGISNATAAEYTQIDSNGNPYTNLPLPINTSSSGAPTGKPDPRFPGPFANKYFNLDTYVNTSADIGDLVHRYYQEQIEIDGGKMDKYAVTEDAKGLTMGYWHTSDLVLAKYATNGVLCDNYFHSAFGGSFLNHQWLIAAATPQWASAPASVRAVVTNGVMTKDGFVTPDGHLINTCYSVNHPYATFAADSLHVPSITGVTTIGDQMNAANVSWAWYSGGWWNALAGHPDGTFQFHHQPFAYYAQFADGTAQKAKHLLDETTFDSACVNGTLPSVSFVKPLGINNEHPGYTSLAVGEQHIDSLITNVIMKSPQWDSTLIIITYDEHGGEWDHVAPPLMANDAVHADIWGPGSRVPCILYCGNAAFLKAGTVDHTYYETSSILALIEKRFSVGNLNSRDKVSTPFIGAFNF